MGGGITPIGVVRRRGDEAAGSHRAEQATPRRGADAGADEPSRRVGRAAAGGGGGGGRDASSRRGRWRCGRAVPAARLGRFDHVSRTAPGFFFSWSRTIRIARSGSRRKEGSDAGGFFFLFGDGEKGRGKLQFIYV